MNTLYEIIARGSSDEAYEAAVELSKKSAGSEVKTDGRKHVFISINMPWDDIRKAMEDVGMVAIVARQE